MVEAIDPAFQRAIWEVRKAGLNIMMSMKTAGKPVSFIEDCAVPLEHLADYTERLTDVFHKHGTTGTWYAHASEGCLHVRPVLNLKLDLDVKKMRAIAEETFALVREYKGSHSGEHGDGISGRSSTSRCTDRVWSRPSGRSRRRSIPSGMFNPGKIVDAPKMDDRRLFRFRPGYAPLPIETALDWSDWNGFSGAVEMCNNNGACRKSDASVMCPSYRATRTSSTSRADAPIGCGSPSPGSSGRTPSRRPMYETLDLCVGCKGCKRECPTGVDISRMKIEFLHHYCKRHGLPLRERLIAWLPRYAPAAASLAPLLNLRNDIPPLARVSETMLGFAAARPLPTWGRPWREAGPVATPADVIGDGRDVILFGDTFNRYFEREKSRGR